MKAEFDAVADAYLAQLRESTRGSGDEPEYFARYKIMDIRRDRTARHLDCDGQLTCLDFGAGIGTSEAHLRNIFPKARIIAADVSKRSLEINEGLHGGAAEYL
ncbi:MAG TPA: class I SAM-dependent methyltransferase, partial [Hyphomonadaceae bacterium]|nr:class I SAM-dependent methyltransferase [Hyphomonadaceae bacterium]